MAKLYFHYSSMNAGKSTTLLQSSYNYIERGMHTLILAPALDDRFGSGRVTSRIGIGADAQIFSREADIFALVSQASAEKKLDCLLVDEAQFLTKDQVFALARVCDELAIPVLAYGLRTDFRGEPFEGSKYLLAWADNLKEIKTVCHCGKKATMVVRQNADGSIVKDGAQVEIGGNDRYVSLCRRHFNASFHRAD
ncbi:MAG: thymidine kinase [Congregibacter sp.]|nr:thymidine kinase [Congregibacter sp.]